MIYSYKLVKQGKYSLLTSIPKKYIKRFQNLESIYLFFDSKSLNLVVFFRRIPGIELIKSKLMLKNKQPGLVIPQKIIIRARERDQTFNLEPKDFIFISDDEENEALIIHLGWNLNKIRSIISFRQNISIEMINQLFCENQQYCENKRVMSYISNKIKTLVLLGECINDSGFIKKL